MKCPKCQSELFEKAKFCSQCGKPIRWDDQARFPSNTSSPLDGENMTGRSSAGGVLKAPSGLKRTLSTELVGRQTERPSPVDLNPLVASRTWEAGQTVIQKGDGNRDLFFLIKGRVEILTSPEGGDFVLNEVDAPHILGDIAFLSGLPRTASVVAKTDVKAFVLRYDHFTGLFGKFPEWLHPLLSSFTSGIKSLHYRIAELEGQAQALKKRSD
ncbi:MAG: hypothetical protein AMK69_26280 [Nitrospira bacterium SG8_3]|jgi:hypothetical protein|nr:MAG: hypothetical protein AMK69_26280 [Nitrospira bacterium SG8_3]